MKDCDLSNYIDDRENAETPLRLLLRFVHRFRIANIAWIIALQIGYREHSLHSE